MFLFYFLLFSFFCLPSFFISYYSISFVYFLFSFLIILFLLFTFFLLFSSFYSLRIHFSPFPSSFSFCNYMSPPSLLPPIKSLFHLHLSTNLCMSLKNSCPFKSSSRISSIIPFFFVCLIVVFKKCFDFIRNSISFEVFYGAIEVKD